MHKIPRSQLSKHTYKARAVEIRRFGEFSSENENRFASKREYAS